MTTRSREDWFAPFEPSAQRPFDRTAVTHLLRRTALGHPPALIERCLALGPQGAAASLVAGEPPDAREARLVEMRDVVLASEDAGDLAGWWLARLLMTRHPLLQRMALFWHDHFATSARKVKSAYWMAQQLAAFEAHGLGEFRTLLLRIARGPAMLRWLDNEQNRKGRANENFARELFELFTLGRDNYSEGDIQEAARAFTGWRIARERFFFDRRRHDPGAKTIFGRSGRFSGEQVIDLALGREDCARFLAHKLLAAFVGPKYPREALGAFGRILRARQLHIGEALQVLLSSELFYRPVHRAARIHGPVEWVVWFLRTLECTAAPKALARAAGRMGQALLDPPDVSGWAEEEAWLSSASWLHRANLAGVIGSGKEPYRLCPELPRLVRAHRPAGEVAWLVERLFPEGIAQDELRELEAQARAEDKLSRPVRLQGLLRACLMLPRAHRF